MQTESLRGVGWEIYNFTAGPTYAQGNDSAAVREHSLRPDLLPNVVWYGAGENFAKFFGKFFQVRMLDDFVSVYLQYDVASFQPNPFGG